MHNPVNLRFQKRETTPRAFRKSKSGNSRAGSSGSNHEPIHMSPHDITLRSSESLEISLKQLNKRQERAKTDSRRNDRPLLTEQDKQQRNEF